MDDLEKARAEAAKYREALIWIRDGLDSLYSVTNPSGLRRLPDNLLHLAGPIASMHKTAIIALGEEVV